jgi:uroporphyrinogen-III synthase
MTAPIFDDIKDKQVLWIKGNAGRRVIEADLLAKKASITELQVYQTHWPHYPASTIDEMARLAIDIVILTSEQSICHYHQLFQHHPHMFTLPCVLVLSTRLATLAKKYFKSHILISRHDLILATIQTYKDSL